MLKGKYLKKVIEPWTKIYGVKQNLRMFPLKGLVDPYFEIDYCSFVLQLNNFIYIYLCMLMRIGLMIFGAFPQRAIGAL